jgi:hypothetical protein
VIGTATSAHSLSFAAGTAGILAFYGQLGSLSVIRESVLTQY